MNNLSKSEIERIINFFNSIELNHLNVNEYLNEEELQELDFSNPFEEIIQLLDNKNAFDIEIIYYSEAMKYLTLHDTSLTDSLQIANELGYAVENLNSELLASLLASQITRDAFGAYFDEIENFFINFDEK